MARRRKKKKKTDILSFIIFIVILGTVLSFTLNYFEEKNNKQEEKQQTVDQNKKEEENSLSQNDSDSTEQKFFDLSLIDQFSDSPFFIVNNNKPFFTEDGLNDAKTSYEKYGELDNLKRATESIASIGKDLMPTEKREQLSYKPTGWVQNKYDTKLVNSGYIYNRCHLIGFQLTGENDNPKNLITCTRYMNTEGMLTFENMIADYIKETGNHVLYRVTPIFEGDNLLASGALQEAFSIEDNGEGIEFCVYVYNVQPGIEINYSSGENHLKEN